MEIDATTETIMTDEVMTDQPPAAAAMETEGDAPPARLMITKMVRFNPNIAHRPNQSLMTPLSNGICPSSPSLSSHTHR